MENTFTNTFSLNLNEIKKKLRENVEKFVKMMEKYVMEFSKEFFYRIESVRI